MSERKDAQLELGRRLKQARTAAGYTQQQVAELLKLSRPTIADIESGRRRVDSLLLRDLAGLFGVHPWEFLEPADDETSKTARLRQALFEEIGAAQASAADKEQIAQFWQMLEHFARLSKGVESKKPPLPEEGRHFTTRVPSYLIEAEADRVREAIGLGEFPLQGDLRHLIEGRGIPVFRWPLEPNVISGLFLNHPVLGPVLLVNASQVRWRQNFTLAHELAHLWLHRREQVVAGRLFAAGRDPRLIETQANIFAAEFLMPGQVLRRAIAALGVEGPRTAEEVVRLQRYFGVSYRAMLVRLKRLRMIKREQFEHLGERSPVRLALQLGYEIDSSEVGESRELRFYEQLPTEYVALVLRAWDDGLIGEGKVAQMLGTDRYSLNEFMRLLEKVRREQQEEVVPAGIGG